MKRLLLAIIRTVATILLLSLLVLTIFSVSPIYRFSAPKAFSGPAIYNPYDGFSGDCKRACFHTHTRVKSIFNESPQWPDSVWADYQRFGYDIVGFSNHNTLTRHPADTSLQIDVYEHGYSFFKFHKLVFNPGRIYRFDHILPFFVSQKQWQLDYLGGDADFVMMNHPDRTILATPRSMRQLTGYRLIEADCNISSELLRWDEALSAGHYSHNLISDDCHDTRDHRKIARRCSWLDVPSARYEDIAPVLIKGNFYSMRIPDFGNGNWEVKYRENAKLPSIKEIGVSEDTVFVRFSAPARIEAWGQDHEKLAEVNSDYMAIVMEEQDPYLRFTANFENGVIIYTNAFARYDPEVSDSPYVVAPHKVNVLLTILWNAGLLAVAILLLRCLLAVFPHKKKETRPTVEQLRFRGIVP
jgi:hypothetical protein